MLWKGFPWHDAFNPFFLTMAEAWALLLYTLLTYKRQSQMRPVLFFSLAAALAATTTATAQENNDDKFVVSGSI